MSNTIDILCVVDAATLAAKVASGQLPAGSLNAPTSLGSYSQSDVYVFMITENCYVVNEQAQSELTIQCDVGDNIRWTITNPGAGVEYSSILYNFQSAAIGTYVTQPICLPLAVNLYINNPSNPTAAMPIAYTSSAWQTTALQACNSVQYSWSFQVLNQQGTVIGYFQWDPFITIEL